MTKPNPKIYTAARRMADYRTRLREKGLRPVQLWLPDTRSAEFVKQCHEQALAIARQDTAGDAVQAFIDESYDWSHI